MEAHAIRSLFVGINGGHHRSTALAFEPGSGSFFSVRGAPLNCHSAASSHASERLNSLVDKLIRQTGSPRHAIVIERLVLTVPGAISFREERARGCHQNLVEWLDENENIRDWEVIDDTWGGLYAETGAPAGICGYASAGASVCIAAGEFTTDKNNKIDGWGPIIGDFGSAFEIVVDYFRQLGRRLDRGETSPVFQKVKDFANRHQVFTMARQNGTTSLPNLDEVKHVQEWFDDLCQRFPNGEWRSVFAALARPILEYADDYAKAPDSFTKEAHDIVVASAQRFSESILIAANHYTQLPVVLQGGLIRACRAYRETTLKHIDDAGVHATVARAKTVVGALMLAVDGLCETSGVWTMQATKALGVVVRDQYLDSIATRAIIKESENG